MQRSAEDKSRKFKQVDDQGGVKLRFLCLIQIFISRPLCFGVYVKMHVYVRFFMNASISRFATTGVRLIEGNSRI
jgi:hypothetical protein